MSFNDVATTNTRPVNRASSNTSTAPVTGAGAAITNKGKSQAPTTGSVSTASVTGADACILKLSEYLSNYQIELNSLQKKIDECKRKSAPTVADLTE